MTLARSIFFAVVIASLVYVALDALNAAKAALVL